MKLVALKTFLNRGQITREGEEFTVNEGMAYDYLKNGLARRIDDDTVKEVEAPSVTAPTEKPLGSMKVGELRELAGKLGITNPSDLNKQELITAISATL